MSKFNELKSKFGRGWRAPVKSGMVVALAAALGGCYTPQVNNHYNQTGTAPWWCKGTPDLTKQQCSTFSTNLDFGLYGTESYVTLDAYIADGAAEVVDRPADIGVAYSVNWTLPTFDPNAPNVLLYDGTAPTSRLVGVAWEISGASAPEGFEGSRDVWTQNATTGNWWLAAWVVRGYENHPNVFATSHPCLTSTGSILTSTTDTCFTASHTEPFEILVTNDDGFYHDGIDALVEGLYGLPNVVVSVVAPWDNQSGSGDVKTRPGYFVTGTPVTTNSGRPATAVLSTDPQRPGGSGSPADSVMYAITALKVVPEIVMSGMNQGQNIGPFTNVSGTVGAARTARRNGIPAIATSQGGTVPPNDFPTGLTATLALLEEWRLGHTVNTTTSVLNINIPTCAATFVPRGTLQTVVAKQLLGRNFNTQDCASTVTTINDDIDAFNHGFIGIANAGAKKPPNWP